jgi:hypothetical protein
MKFITETGKYRNVCSCALYGVGPSLFHLMPVYPSGLFFSCGGARLSQLGMSASNWPIEPAPDNR